MTTTKLMTAEDLWELEDDGCRHELIRGELLSMAPTGGVHGELLYTLVLLLASQQVHDYSRVFVGDTGFRIGQAEETVLAPDIAIVRTERLPGAERISGFIPVVPDLVVEILSPSDRIGRVNEKVALYLEGGVQLIWLVDPDRQTVTEHAPAKPVRLLQSGDVLTADELSPGLRIQVDEIFE